MCIPATTTCSITIAIKFTYQVVCPFLHFMQVPLQLYTCTDYVYLQKLLGDKSVTYLFRTAANHDFTNTYYYLLIIMVSRHSSPDNCGEVIICVFFRLSELLGFSSSAVDDGLTQCPTYAGLCCPCQSAKRSIIAIQPATASFTA